MLVQLIYISNPVGPLVHEITDFIENAKSQHKLLNVTGLLLVTDTHYIHCIEGDRSIINKLYIKISNTLCHSNCTIVRYNEIAKREFGDLTLMVSKLPISHASATLSDLDISIEDINAAKVMALLRRTAAYHRTLDVNSTK